MRNTGLSILFETITEIRDGTQIEQIQILKDFLQAVVVQIQYGGMVFLGS